jgi:hypothetical protein
MAWDGGKDWAQEAAEEIKAAQGPDMDLCWRLNAVLIREVIVKHRPMKEDTAYMPVPRCRSCAWWSPRGEGDPPTGWCNIENSLGNEIWTELYDRIVTTEDFGCVQWKEK